jgi:hypothetical protein
VLPTENGLSSNCTVKFTEARVMKAWIKFIRTEHCKHAKVVNLYNEMVDEFKGRGTCMTMDPWTQPNGAIS